MCICNILESMHAERDLFTVSRELIYRVQLHSTCSPMQTFVYICAFLLAFLHFWKSNFWSIQIKAEFKSIIFFLLSSYLLNSYKLNALFALQHRVCCCAEWIVTFAQHTRQFWFNPTMCVIDGIAYECNNKHSHTHTHTSVQILPTVRTNIVTVCSFFLRSPLGWLSALLYALAQASQPAVHQMKLFSIRNIYMCHTIKHGRLCQRKQYK